MLRLSGALFVGLCAFAIASVENVAHAAIVAGGDGTQNTSAVGTVAQFNNVGSRGAGGSGVYLGPDTSGNHPGDGWVLTAAHVGAGPIFFGGNLFSDVAGSAIRLHDPNTNLLTDLVVYRIASAPVLPALTIATSTPGVGTSVVMAGNGVNRDPNLTQYLDAGGAWTEVPSGGNRAGYKWASGNSIRWGNNVTENASLVGDPSGPTTTVNIGFGDVRALLTQFNNLANEGQVASGDSGGALFDSTGTLVGMLDARGTLNNQPANTAIFGDVTFAADLSYYRPQIVAAMVPEPTGALLLVAACGVMACRRRRAS